MIGGFLERMAEASRVRVARARARVPEGRLLARARATPAPPPLTLQGFDVIAELKLRSPAAGGLAKTGFDRSAQVEAYAAGGAAAISVLTEPDEFRGDLAHVGEAVAQARARCPVLRKDFLTDAYQVIEARAAGAGGVLLIVTMLEDADLDAMLACARELGLFVLLEAFDADDLVRIGALAPDTSRHTVLAGLNCRDLKTLEVDFERLAALAPLLPAHLPCVAESGVEDVADIRRLTALGYRLALVGSALMRTADPRATLAEWLAAGRAGRAQALACS